MQGRRYEERPMNYESLPDMLPDGEYRFDVTIYTIIDGKKRNFCLTQALGVLKPTKAEQWRK